ncbi:MAG: hypothetical protein EA368_00595 [Leptolyngbya sp. DLM2.Bin27]|nr:MAG: hypothetical protein EA368_00595 [Leptolyngbya sp. DLM2.Bin27]
MKSLFVNLASRAAGDTSKLLTALGLFFLVWGTIAPISTLSWWLKDGNGLADQRPELPDDALAPGDGPPCYLVFLTGVGDLSDQALADGEAAFLDELEATFPQCAVVRDVFPYSAASDDVGGQPFFRWLWDISESFGSSENPARMVLQARNLWRVALSADNRYGQAYNRGTAATIIERMAAAAAIDLEADPPPQLIMMGTSGGAQVALGAAPYLVQWLPLEITVISLGGVFDGQEGFDAAEQVYHFHSDNDWVDNFGSVLFPSRWRWTWGSPFNRARRSGRYQAIASGPHEHDGDRGYFGQDPMEDPANKNGTTYLDSTLAQVKALSIWDNF